MKYEKYDIIHHGKCAVEYTAVCPECLSEVSKSTEKSDTAWVLFDSVLIQKDARRYRCECGCVFQTKPKVKIVDIDAYPIVGGIIIIAALLAAAGLIFFIATASEIGTLACLIALLMLLLVLAEH